MATRIRFTENCSVTRQEDGTLAIQWTNGNAIAAVNGAAVEHIPAHMRIRGVVQAGQFQYRFVHDVAAMIDGGLNARLAIIIGMCRRSILAFEGAQVNIAEAHTVAVGAHAPVVDQANFEALVAGEIHVVGIVQLAATVFGFNGLSMLLKGHNYKSDDRQWMRLETATQLSSHFEALNITDWEGAFLHDMAHPMNLNWKVLCVVRPDSVIIGHINGVLMTRLPGTPAGTAVIYAAKAVIAQILIAKPQARAVIGPLGRTVAALCRRVDSEPMEWCKHFQRTNTMRNLHIIDMLKPALAFVYGMAEELFSKTSTTLRAAALQAASKSQLSMSKDGRKYAATLEDVTKSVEEYRRQVSGYALTAARSLGELPAIPGVPQLDVAHIAELAAPLGHVDVEDGIEGEEDAGDAPAEDNAEVGEEM